MRLVPLLAGSAIPVLFALMLKGLKLPPLVILLGSLPVCWDTALVTDARLILPESLLVAAILGSLVVYLMVRKQNKWWLWLLLGLMAGVAVSIKWTGLASLGLILGGELWTFLKAHSRKNLLRLLMRSFLVVGISFAFYFTVFQVHFALLPNAGPGDAFMSPAFQKTLLGSPFKAQPGLVSLGPWGKFWELNVRMLTANETLTATHPYASVWYTWPFDFRPIYYWDHNTERIYFLGNPLIWWGSTAAVVVLFLLLWSQRLKHRPETNFLLSAWAINFLPFIFIGRVMFLYHYLTAMIFAVAIGVWLLSQTRRRVLWLAIFAGGSFTVFLWFSPLVYGLPLTSAELSLRQWFTSWR
jgi:dolichyl-phosphate-mannose-protein mannosyltransferase